MASIDWRYPPLTNGGHYIALFRVINAWSNQWVERPQQYKPDVERIIELERETKHDVAACRKHLEELMTAERHLSYFGQTSEDVVGLAYRLQIVNLPIMKEYITPKDHGYNYVPLVKWTGATGNYHTWMEMGFALVEILGRVHKMLRELEMPMCKHELYATQVSSNEDLIDLLSVMLSTYKAANSKEWQFIGKPIAEELVRSLPISRWQRDLSNSTRMRSLGVVFDSFQKAMEEK